MGRIASGPLPESATSGQIARACGYSERTINGRKGDGKLPVHADGGVDLYRVVKAGVDALAAGVGVGLDESRARESRLRGDRLELINAQLRADLVPADEMEAVVGAAFDAVRVKLLAVPVALATRLAAMGDVADVREALTKAIHDALGDLANEEVVDVVKERARTLARRPEGDAATGAEDGAAA